MELGWRVVDGDKRYHDEIRIWFGLVWERVWHDSVDFAAASWLTVLPTVYLVLLDVWLASCRFVWQEAPLFFLAWLLLRLTWLVFRNRHNSDNSNKSDKKFDLLLIQSNVQDPMLMKGVQEEKWAGGNLVWYLFIYSKTIHFIRFTILHTNVKWHRNQNHRSQKQEVKILKTQNSAAEISKSKKLTPRRKIKNLKILLGPARPIYKQTKKR